MAPELISGDGQYGEGVDVYGFGMMLYSMITLTEPHQAMRAAIDNAMTATEAENDRFEGIFSDSSGSVPVGLATSTSGLASAGGHPTALSPAALIHALCIQKLRPQLDHRSHVPTPLIKVRELLYLY
jgi:hypothetical protein